MQRNNKIKLQHKSVEMADGEYWSGAFDETITTETKSMDPDKLSQLLDTQLKEIKHQVQVEIPPSMNNQRFLAAVK